MRNKGTAIAFALFLGGLGIHQFYLNKSNKGIRYALFFRTLIPAFIAVIDLFMLLFMSQEKFDRKYNQGVQKSDGSFVRFTNVKQ